jgi:acyl-CoA thioesterase I
MNKKFLVPLLILAIVVIVYFIFGSSPDIVNYPPKNDTVVAFGDSLVQGVGATKNNDFVSLLSRKIERPIENLGVSGETSAQGLERIDKIISKKPGTVIVLFGGNDFLRKVPREETFKNLHQIISELQSSGSMVVLLGIRGGILSDQFKSDFKNLAQETGSIYIPNVLAGLLGNQEYMSDSIHPNDAGYAIIAEKIYSEIEDYLK